MERSCLQSKRIQELLKNLQGNEQETVFLLKNFAFFHNLDLVCKESWIIERLAGFLVVEEFEKDSVVYNVNSIADKVYLVLEGQVVVYKSVLSSRNPLLSFHPSALKDQLMQALVLNRRLSRSFVRSEPWSLTSEFFTLSSFESFGEEVVSDNPYRLNSVLTKEKTLLLSLQNSAYRKVLRQVQKEKKSDLKSFLRSLDVFSQWSSRSLDKVLDFSQTQTLSKNQVLYRQGDQADFVFFIKEGEFLISQTVKLTKEARRDFQQSPSGCLLKLSKMRQKSPEKNLQVAIKGKKELLGAEEISLECGLRRFSCVCITDSAVVVKFSKENFVGKILGAENAAGFKRKVDLSAKWAQNRIDEIRGLGFGELSNDEKKQDVAKEKRAGKRSQRIHTLDDRELRKSSQSFRPAASLSLERSRQKEEVKVVRHRFQIKRDPPPSFLIGLREKIEQRKKSRGNDEVCYTLPF